MIRGRQLRGLDGVRVTVLGLGRFGGGVGVTRFLVDRGAKVTVTDMADESDLVDSLKAIEDLDLEAMCLGGHPDAAFRDCQIVIANPAIAPHADVWNKVTHVPLISSELELFTEHCPAPLIAVTGSNGKSTTAALIHHLLNASGQRVFLGGNIGVSLLDQLDSIRSGDHVVLEVSSFQLERLRDSGFAPQIAVLTQFAPNHLDWHGGIAAYHASKQLIFDRQSMQSLAVLPDQAEVNMQGAAVPSWRVRARLHRFGTTDSGEDGVFFDDGSLIFRRHGFEDALRLPQCPELPGEHNLQNLAAAACAAWEAGGEPSAIVEAVPSFKRLPHRFQNVARAAGISFVNDSVSTTPESVIAALRTVSGDVSIIAGGADKRVDLTLMAGEIAATAAGCVLIGQTSTELTRLIRHAGGAEFSLQTADDLTAAVQAAAQQLPDGGTVLLSPGCASFGMFRDFCDRGERFVVAVKQWVEANAG